MTVRAGQLIYSELQSIANGIGKHSNGVYVKEQDALDCVKDLIKSLRRENETCDIRRFLGLAQVLQEDLIPLTTQYGLDDDELFEVTIRCLMNLTQPARIVFKNEIPQEKTTRHSYMETESYLQSYKKAFVNRYFLQVISQRLASLLELNWEDRSEEQNMLIERVLVLLRNILHVPTTDVDKIRTDDDASVHDQVIWHMHQVGLDKLILYIASSDEEKRFCVHVLEIVSLMFREQTPEQLATAGASRNQREKERDEQELIRVAEMEKAVKKAQVLKLSSRHPRFGGTYVMKGLKSISEKDIIYHRALGDAKEHTFDNGKKPKKKPKNRRPIEGDENTRRSTLSIRVCMKDFCVEFIKKCYNPLMRSVKYALDRDSSQENDETYYLWSMRFFMQFQRLYHFDVELVRETMSVQEFHYAHTMMLNHQDMMMMDKKEALIWGKRLHLALRTYRELLETLQAMSQSASSAVRESAKVIQQNVFYLQEYRDIILTLLKKFDNTRQSKLYAKDLVETAHLYIRAMEKWCGSQGKVLVQKKKKKAIRKKKTPAGAPPEEPKLTEGELEEKWDDLSENVSELLQDLEKIDEQVSPFDATSDVNIDDQRLECVRTIHELLHDHQSNKAVALMRAAREVWPENEEFGSADISPEDEFMILREVFFADIPHRQQPQEPNPADEADLYGEEIEEEEMDGVQEEEVTSEEQFEMKVFLMSFSSPRVIQVYGLLLTLWKTNDIHTNHCIVKMLHRITVQNDMVALLFQLSLFRTFQKILNDDSAKASAYKEMKTFALYVVRQFFKIAEKSPKVYVEMLFWKNAKECREIMDGYGTYRTASQIPKNVWTEEQENELRTLYEEHMNSEGDIVDNILANLIDTNRTRRHVIRQLIIMDLVTDSKQLKKGISGKSRTANQWTEEQQADLINLYESHRNDADPVGEIMLKLDRPRRQIINKLVELGTVEDRTALHKNGRKKRDKGRERDGVLHIGAHDDSESESADSSSGGSDTDEASGPFHPFADLSRGDSSELLAQLRAIPDMDYSLSWIQRSLNRTAEDREDEDEEPEATALIPLMEECETALQDKTFQRFIYTIGINPPTNEQEQFWRISLEVNPEKLRQVASAIEKDSGNEFPELSFTYNIPTASAERKTKSKKPKSRSKAPAKGKPTGNQVARKSRPQKETMSLSKPPVSREFLSSDDSSSESDTDQRLKIDENPSTNQDEGDQPSTSAARLESASDNEDSNTHHESDKENTHITSSAPASSEDEAPLSKNLTRKKTKKVKIDRRVKASRVKRSQADSGSSDEETVNNEANMSDGDGAKKGEDLSNAPKYDSFPATALTQQFPESSDSDDDHITIARAVHQQGMKRKANVLSDDSE